MTRRILVVLGTPIAASLAHALADSYVVTARGGGADVRVIDLANDPIPPHPQHRDEVRMPREGADRPLEDSVAAYVEDIRWADHLSSSRSGGERTRLRSRVSSTASSSRASPSAIAPPAGGGTAC